ncbi:MAG: SDR family NAD(P)-dependent oxidoreductase, partial [Chloroflexi bacterium]|nr:SDR family NAD(P)-dependent oxidoreductase [Chloroflexota bacterium]
MNDFNGRVAVITGAASGIGMGLAEKAAGEGMKVVLADIEEQALAEVERHLKS